nr:hypothetical protein [Tanacetum cinerariifolium]
MDTTIDQQVAMDEALVPHAKRLWTGRSDFHLLSDIKSKESTLQLVYDVLHLSSLFKDFLVTADVPEIYMQEFWATTTVHHHSILFKMDNKMHTVNLESFREMFHICPRLPHQLFIEPPFEEEILVFLWFLGHSGAIRRLTDVNINKLHQPWGSFAAIINKCLTEKSSGYHSLQLSQAQILWGLYHKRNVDLAYLMWEDFVYQVKHKDTKKSNEMYYPRFTKVIIHHFMSKDPSILRRNKVNWHYVRDDHMFFTIKLTKSSFDTTITPPTATAGPRLTTSEKGKQAAKASKAKSLSALSEVAMTEAQQLKLVTKRSLQQTHISQASGSGADEGTGSIPGVLDVPTDESKEEISWNYTDEEGDDDEGKEGDGDDEGNNGDGANCKENVGREEGYDEEEKEDTLYRDVNINQRRGIQTTQEVEDSYVTLTPVNPDGQQQSSSVSSQFVTSMLNPTPDAGMESIFKTTAQMDTLEANFFEFMQTNQFARAVSAILGIEQYMDQQMNKVVKVAVQIQSDRLRDEAQADNDEFLNTIDENMQKIIKEQVKEQVSKILPKIEQTVNEQLEAEVLTWNLYKAFVDAYESDKIILDASEDTVMLKRRYDDDADKDKEPSARSNRGSKRRRERKEPESASAPKEKATRSAGKSTQGSKSRQTSASESATAEEPMQTTFEMEEPIHLEFETGADDQPIIESSHHPECFSQQKKPPTLDRDWNKTLPATHRSIQPWISKLAKQSDSRSSFNELMDTPVDFSNFLMNRLRVDTLTPELLAGPTYELMKGSCKSLVELEYQLDEVYKATTDQLDWVNPEGQQYPHNLLKPLPLIPNNRGRRVIPFDHFINNNLEYLRGGDFKRLRIQDIEDMLLLLVQGKLTNLIVEERFAFNVSLRMFTRSIVIQRRAEDLQLGVESYQKKLNLTKPDTYRFDLKRKEAYIADGTLIDVRTALDDRLKWIRMKYLPHSIWRKSDKDREAAMIHAIDKRLKTRRIMRSLEWPTLCPNVPVVFVPKRRKFKKWRHQFKGYPMLATISQMMRMWIGVGKGR